MFFVLEGAAKTILDFSQGTVRVLYIYFSLREYKYKMTQYKSVNAKLPSS